jgi:hypothetical protein
MRLSEFDCIGWMRERETAANWIEMGYTGSHCRVRAGSCHLRTITEVASPLFRSGNSATFRYDERLVKHFRFQRKAGDSVYTFRRAVLAIFTIAELFILLVALAKPAYGYVDPGSGLLAVQVGGSMLAGGLFILRSKIRRLFRHSDAEPPAEKKQPATPDRID